MAKVAYLFSGQGSQYCGMGKEFYDAFPEVRAIYECAADILGRDIAAISFGEDEEELAKTQSSQPAIFAMSLAAYTVASKELPSPAAIAGHSLGEYAALCAAGVVSMEDGFRIIGARAKAMQKAADANPGAMYAIIGAQVSAIEAACEQAGGYVLPVNFNSTSQTVIAGETAAAQTAAELLTEQGYRAVKLGVSSAFHCKLMESAAKELKDAVADIPFATSTIPFYSNVTGELLTDFSDMPSYFYTHMVSPVRFTSELDAMANAGIDSFLELGPNKVLTGLVKKTLKGVSALNFENEKTKEKAVAALKG